MLRFCVTFTPQYAFRTFAEYEMRTHCAGFVRALFVIAFAHGAIEQIGHLGMDAATAHVAVRFMLT